MKKYIGTKVVMAEPMNECVAIKNGFARPIPKDQEFRNGYHVRYEDGYDSWSPDYAFDKAYRVCETYLDRMKIEHKDLCDKLLKLDNFLDSENCQKLSQRANSLLRFQKLSMDLYKMALEERMKECESEL